MSASPRRRRRGLTLAEGLVAAALLALFVASFWHLWSSASRQSTHAQQTSTLLRSAVLIREALSRDLLGCVALESLPEEERPLGEERPILHLPVFDGYHASAADALSFRTLVWRWDADAEHLLRDGRPLVRHGLRGARFAWTATEPRELRVVLVGDGLEGRSRELTLRFPGPPPSTAHGAWRLAGHHETPVPAGP